MRQGVCVLWEAMVAEMRAVQLDLAARAKFTEDGGTVRETRGVVADWTQVGPVPAHDHQRLSRSAANLASANDGGSVEVG